VTCEFLSGLTKLPPVTITTGVGTIGSTGTLYLFLAGRNRAGWTIASDPTIINYTPTSAITINLPAPARGDGTDFIRYALSANTTNDPLTSIQIGEWENYQLDQITPRTLDPIVLTTPEQIQLGTTIATPSLLPTGADLINGMHRLITGGLPNSAAASYYKYSQFELGAAVDAEIIEPNPGEKWVRVLSPFTGQITDAFGIGGCALDVRQIDPTYVIAPPFYDPNQPNPVKGTPIKLVWRNNSTIALKAGTSFGLEVRQGLENHTDLFNGKLIIALRGYTDGLGGLDRSDGGSGYLPFVDVDRVWAYDDDAIGILTLDRDLAPGVAVVWEIAPYFTAQQFQGSLASGELISIYLYPYSQSGKLVKALAAITGDLILPGGRLLPLPQPGLSLKVGRGSAVVKGFAFESVIEQTFTFAQNTAAQKLCIDGNGICTIRATALAAEAILAIVSTTSGDAQLRSTISSLSLTVGESINIVISQPGYTTTGFKIRPGYPVLADQIVPFIPTNFVLYAYDGSNYYELLVNGSNLVAATNSATQTVVATGLGPIATITIPAADRGFFDPPTIAATIVATGGTIPTGSYEILIGYTYSGTQIAAIDRSSAIVIPELSAPLNQLSRSAASWGGSVSDAADLRLLDASQLADRQVRSASDGALFYYDANSTAADNSIDRYRPDHILITDPGRWLKLVTGGGGSGLAPWFEMAGNQTYAVPPEGGRFSVNTAGFPGDVILLLPLNPAAGTEVTYQIVDNTADSVYVQAQLPNRIADNSAGVSGKHNNSLGRFAIETLRFVGGRWLPQHNRLTFAAPPPVNDLFANRTVITGNNISITASNVSATFETGEPPHLYDGEPIGTSIWWSWTPTYTETVTINAVGVGIDVVLGIYQPTVPAQTDLTLGILIEAGNLFSGGAGTPVTFLATIGLEYIIAVTGYFAVSGDIALTLVQAPVNNTFANRATITGQTATITATNIGATYEPNEPAHFANGNSSVWWSWTPAASGTVTITGVSTQNSLILTVYTGADLVAGLTLVQQESFNAPGGFPADTPISFLANSGTEYQIAVCGFLGGSDDFTLTLDQV
jgi:hypothetical protein